MIPRAQRLLYASRLHSVITFAFTLLGVLSLRVDAAMERVGINFVGGSTSNGTPATLGSTEQAGFVSQRFWNNASGKTGTIAPEGDADAGFGAFYSGFSVSWSALNTDSTPVFDTGGNNRLMKGHLLAEGSGSITVTLSNIPYANPGTPYSLIVYLDGDNSAAGRVGKYTLSGTALGTKVVYGLDKIATDFAGTFRQISLTSRTDEGQFTPDGNVIIFTGLTDANLTLTVAGANSGDGLSRATLARIQLVNTFAGAPVASAPATPVNITPAQGATGISLTPTLQASAFSDTDAADTHAASQWIVWRISDSSIMFNSGEDAANKVSCPVPSSAGLAYSTRYSWQVRYKDSSGAWSDYSTVTEFTTQSAPNAAPSTPVNTAPANAAAGVGRTTLLQASAFSDSDVGDTHAASQWIVRQVSDNSVILDSGEDATNKTSRTVSGLSYATAYYWQVRYKDSRGAWSAYSTATTFTTGDESTTPVWTRVTFPPSVTVPLTGAAYGAGKYVVVGYAGTILTSTDGISWVQRTSGVLQNLLNVAYGAGTFVAVGEKGTILTSADGLSWVKRSANTSETSETHFYDVVFGDHGFVVVGGYGAIRTSPTGTTWTSRSPGTPYSLYGVSYGNGLYIAVGAYGALITSLDGVNWTTRNSGVTTALHAVTFGNNTFVAVGDYATVLSSSNGITWATRNPVAGESKHFYGVTFGDGLFVAVGTGNWIWSSTDGTTWTDRSLGTGVSFNGIGYGAGGFFATGANAAGWLLPVGPGTAAAPIITSGGNAQVVAGESFTYQITAYNHPASYSALGLPAGLSVDPATGQISGTPTESGWFTITLSATNAAGTGSAALSLHVIAPGAGTPLNDNFAFATELNGIYVVADGSNVNATRETGEPVHRAGSEQSVWWTWTAPHDGLVAVSTEGSSFDTMLAAYEGSTLATLEQVASDDDGGKGVTSLLFFEAFAGHTYHIAVDSGYPGRYGSVRLTLSQSLAAVKGTYTGIIGSGNASRETSGFFTLALTGYGKFTSSVILGGIRYNFRGTLDNTGRFIGTVKSGTRVLTVILDVQTTVDGSVVVNGSLSQSATQTPFSGGRSIYTSKLRSPHEGKYTLAFTPATDSNDIATTFGYGAVSVSKLGKIRFRGTLADGAKVSQGAIMAGDQWPCFLLPYAKQGLVLGSITFRDVANGSDLDGSLEWFRPAKAKGAFFPVGPADQALAAINVFGSRYTYVPRARVLNFSDSAGNGMLHLSGALLAPQHTEEQISILSFTLSPKNKVIPVSDRSLKMSINVKNGLFSGSFRDGNVKRSFGGAVIQKINVGVGVFKGAGKPGGVIFAAQ